MGDNHWFEPKPWGYGARPANAKGWAAVGVTVAVIVVLAVVCLAIGEPTPTDFVVFIGGTLAAVAALIVVARRKTRGEWRWRSRRDVER